MFNNELWNKPAGGGGGGGTVYSHQIANSCRFSGTLSSLDGTHYMTHVRGTPTNADKCTISAWVKRSSIGTKDQMFTGGGVYGNQDCWFGFKTDNKFYLHQNISVSPVSPQLQSRDVFRDTGAWYHIVLAFDSTQSTAADRNKVYINGVQYTDWVSYTTDATLNRDFVVNTSGNKLFIGSGGASEGNSYYPFSGYIAEYVFIDGTQYEASDFAETVNGVWQPKDPSGLTFGNNGAYLKFESSGNLGNDSSGNNNDFAVTGVAAHDQMGDSPTFSATDGNGGNFLAFNPYIKGSWSELSEGNLLAGKNNNGADATYIPGNICFPTGKWYYEIRIGTHSTYPQLALTDLASNQAPDSYSSGARGYFMALTYTSAGGVTQNSGDLMSNFGTVTLNSTGVASYTTGDIISWYIDADNGKAWFAKNNTIPNSGNPVTGSNPQFAWTGRPPGLTVDVQSIASGKYCTLNAGQDGTFAGEETAQGNADDNGYGNFYYDVPAGFLAVCSGNLPIAAAIDPAQTSDNFPQKLMNPKTYTGNGGTLSVTGVGFQPDFTWNKNRVAADGHRLTDSTRGVTKSLATNTTGAEATDSNGLTAFGIDGFTVGSDGAYNSNGEAMMSWNWRANGGTTSSNTQGDLTSTVQVDPSGGFSIVTYTGTLSGSGTQTVGHGLSKAPSFIITKIVGGAGNWWVWSDFQTSWNYGINLNAATGSVDKSGNGSMSSPNANVFSTNWTDGLNDEQGNIAYCFANIEGYCKVGSYAANATTTNNAYIYTGFRPAFVLVKGIVSGANWTIIDDKRDGYNPIPESLQPPSAGAAYTAAAPFADLLSTGFRIYTVDAVLGDTGYDPYIYLAFAKNPFQFATAR